jgi:cell division transport system permease protein
MTLRLWLHLLKRALVSIRDNRLVNVVCMSTMVISMLILGSFLLLFVNVNNWIQGWGKSWYMTVYLHDNISEENRGQVESFLKKLPSVEIKRYISKETAFSEFKEALGSQAGILEGLSDNPLPASFEVFLRNVEHDKVEPRTIEESLERIEGVEEVQISEEWLRRFEGLMNVVRLAGFVIGGLLCVAILFIVTNSIKLTIYSRRDEIEILKLVGATDWFVKVPFLLEGLLQGLASGFLTMGILFGGYSLLSAKRVHILGVTVVDLVFLPREYVIAIFVLSITLGVMGSLVAVGRFFDL